MYMPYETAQELFRELTGMTLSSAGSRALLVGTGTHAADSQLPNVPAVPATIRDLASALVDRCGMTRESLLPPIIDPSPMTTASRVPSRRASAGVAFTSLRRRARPRRPAPRS